MTFLAPLLLAAAAALAIPLILHLRQREEETLDFPALRYLADTMRRQDRNLRLRDRLLLLLRLLILALLVLGAARLVLPLGGSDHPPAAVVIVIDDGVLSGMVVDGRYLLDHHRDAAHRVLGQLGSADRVWVLSAGMEARGGRGSVGPFSPTEARLALEELESTAVDFDWHPLRTRAASILEARSEAHRQIIAFREGGEHSSGLERSTGLETEAPAPDPSLASEITSESIAILQVAAGRDLPPNTGIVRVDINDGLSPRVGDPIELAVQLGGDSAAHRTVRFIGDSGESVSGRTDARGMVRLSLPPVSGPWLVGHAEIDADDLRADDRYPVAVSTGEPIPVRYAPPPAGPEAMAPDWMGLALDVLEDAGRIRRTEDTAGATVVLVGPSAGVPLPDDAAAILLFPPSDGAELPLLGQALADAGWGWGIQVGSGSGGMARPRNTATLPGSLPRGLSEVEIRQSHRIVRRAGPAGTSSYDSRLRVLAELDSGEPWLVEDRRPGSAGVVRLVGSPLTRSASDLPVSVIWVPLLDYLLDPRPSPDSTSHRAGSNVLLGPETRSVVGPRGALDVIGQTAPRVRPAHPGLHEVLDAAGGVVDRFAVHAAPPPPPATPATGGDDEAGSSAATTSTSVLDPGWTQGVLPDRRGREFSGWLLGLALLLLLVEIWMTRGGSSPPPRSNVSPSPPRFP